MINVQKFTEDRYNSFFQNDLYSIIFFLCYCLTTGIRFCCNCFSKVHVAFLKLCSQCALDWSFIDLRVFFILLKSVIRPENTFLSIFSRYQFLLVSFLETFETITISSVDASRIQATKFCNKLLTRAQYECKNAFFSLKK